MTRKGGRGRTLTGRVVNRFLLDSLKEGTILNTLKKFEYKQGVAREEEFFGKLRKQGLTEKDIKVHLGSLIREGDVYSPRPHFYKRTSYHNPFSVSKEQIISS